MEKFCIQIKCNSEVGVTGLFADRSINFGFTVLTVRLAALDLATTDLTVIR